MEQQATSPATPTAKTRTVAIFGGYTAAKADDLYTFANDLGRGLAEAGFEVLNGGYDGTMAAASKGAKDAGGVTIGVTCPSAITSARGPIEPNDYLDVVLPAPNILSRINTMIRASGAYIFLKGGTGTLAELGIAWEFVAKGFAPPRPIVLANGSWDALAETMFAYRDSTRKHVHQAEDIDDIITVLSEHAVAGTRKRMQKSDPRITTDDLTTVAQLRGLMQRFVEERDWQPFHDPKNLSSSIAIEAAELMEHFQWLRSDQLDELQADESKMVEIREEIADILAYTLSFAETMNIDLSSALADKMIKNATKYPAQKFKGRFE
jgi:dCTP diphosphatase